MPKTITFEGQQHVFPDDFSDADIAAALGTVKPQPGIAEDVVKSGGIGLLKGGIGAAGMGADAREMNAKAINWLSKKLGYEVSPEAASAVLRFMPLMGGATSEQLQKELESHVGPLYQPKTAAGRVAETMGEFAPAVIGGPEALAAKAVTRVAVPALASEAASQLTNDNPIAKLLAAVGSSVLAHGAVTPRPVSLTTTPSIAQLETAARAGYQHPDVAAVQIRPQVVESLADRITQQLNRRGQFDQPELAGATHDIVDRLRNTGATPGLPQGVASVEELRSVSSGLKDMATEVNQATGRPTSNATAAGHAARQIDTFLANLRQPDLIAGDAPRTADILRQANQDWAAASKARMIDLTQMRADRQAGRSGSGSNIENSMRQKIDQIFGPGKETGAGLTAAEREMADRIVLGSGARNALRKVGKLGFSDGLSLLLHGMTAIPTAGASLPIGAGATIARKIGERMTRRDIDALEQAIRNRSAEAARWRAIQARASPPNAYLPAPQFLGPLATGVMAGQATPSGLLGMP